MNERTRLALDTEDHPDRGVRGLQLRRLDDLVANPDEVAVEEWEIPPDRHQLKSPIAFRDQVKAEFRNPECNGAKLPANKTHGLMQFREHEVTVWYGYKKSYKSVFLNELFTHWACVGIPVALASFEMPAFKLAALAVRQATALQTPGDDDIDRAIERLAEAMVIYDVMGKVQPRHMLAIMRYCAIALGCRQFLLDNLTTLLPVGNDNFDLHQQFVSGVLSVARATGMHIHVVAHCAKPKDGDVSKPPSSYNIRGTGAVPDMVDNLIGIWRNIPKEDKLDDDRTAQAKRDELYIEPDLLMLVDNQKFWGFRGNFKYWIDRRLLRFREGAYLDCEPFI